MSLCHKFKFSNPHISATCWCKPLQFQTSIIWYNNIHSLKYLRSTTVGCKDIRIIKSEFVAKTQFLWHSFIPISRDKNIRYKFHGSRSIAKVISFQPKPLSFFLYSPFKGNIHRISDKFLFKKDTWPIPKVTFTTIFISPVFTFTAAI